MAQIVYKYGRGELRRDTNKYPRPTLKLQLQLFKEVCNTIEECRAMVNPRKKFLLCVDGVAGLGKMAQQRQRRYVSARNRLTGKGEICPFDQNCITPGTEFMHNLTKYIDWYIRFMVTHNDDWKKIEVHFSNEKVPGEGEHKIVDYIRKNSPYDKYCIYGADADLFMLSLATEHDKVWILREETHNKRDTTGMHYFVDVSKFRESLIDKHLGWCSDVKFKSKAAIDDFVLMCFMTGNDFLPNIPTMTILNGGIDQMTQIYKNVCSKHGHLTRSTKKYITLRKDAIREFFKELAKLEKPALEEKWESREAYFPDTQLNDYMRSRQDGHGCLQFPEYMEAYYNSHFSSDITLKKLSETYLTGMKWVINYYKFGIPDWEWYYPYHYGPFFSTLVEYVDDFKNENFNKESFPITPFQQLLVVISPQSSKLLPNPINTLLADENSPLKSFNNTDFSINLAGKRREWEGIAEVKFPDMKLFMGEYDKMKVQFSEKDKRRNNPCLAVKYCIGAAPYDFRSFYGEIPDCRTKMEVIR